VWRPSDSGIKRRIGAPSNPAEPMYFNELKKKSEKALMAWFQQIVVVVFAP
jgi:hypothetical protein